MDEVIPNTPCNDQLLNYQGEEILKEMNMPRTQAIDEHVTSISPNNDDNDVQKKFSEDDVGVEKSRIVKKLKVKKKIKKSKRESTKKVDKELFEDEIEEEHKLTKKPSLFQRLFSRDDELSLLQGIIDFTLTEGRSPMADKDRYCAYVKPLITFNASNIQIITKVRNLKKRFSNKLKRFLKKGYVGEDEVFLSDKTNQKAFDLWRKIWGSDGVLNTKSMENLVENLKKEVERAEPPISYGKEIASFIKAENTSSLGLDENAMIVYWDEDDPKDKEMIETFNRLRRMQKELCCKRIEILKSTADLILKENN